MVTEEVIAAAFAAIRKRGTVVITGLAGPGKKTIQLPSFELTLFEKRIQGALFGGGNPFDEIPRLLELYRAGRLKLDELVTTRYRLEDVNQGYRDMLDGRNVRGLLIHELLTVSQSRSATRRYWLDALSAMSIGGSMAETANSEFWRELKPIEQKFRPGALPEAYIANAPTDDERFYAPLSETVGTRPLWISPSQNRWCDVLMCRGAGLVNRHYHPQQVFAYTISGKWGYLEHDWVATAGDWVYEAPGESHTLVAYECDEPMRVTFNVTGPLIWLDENGEPNGTFDVFDYIALCRKHYEQERDRRGLHRQAVPAVAGCWKPGCSGQRRTSADRGQQWCQGGGVVLGGGHDHAADQLAGRQEQVGGEFDADRAGRAAACPFHGAQRVRRDDRRPGPRGPGSPPPRSCAAG